MPDPVEFDLVDHYGIPVTAQTYRGRWLVVQFGFTSCRMICPRALAKLDVALEGIERGGAGDGAGIVPLYVTVDPDRDSPAAMRAYLQASHPRFTGLTGTTEQVHRAERAFRVFARRRADPADPDGYAVPHTAITQLVDPGGRRVAHWGEAVAPERIAADVLDLTRCS